MFYWLVHNGANARTIALVVPNGPSHYIVLDFAFFLSHYTTRYVPKVTNSQCYKLIVKLNHIFTMRTKLLKSNMFYHAPIPQFQKSSCFEPLSHWAYMVTCSSTMRLHITLFESRKLQEYIAHNISILEFYISK